MPNIFVFSIWGKWKCMDWTTTWYIKNLLCIERDNSRRIPRKKTPIPMYKDNQNENMMRKTPPKNSTKDKFLVIPQTLNSHYRDPRRLNNPQNLPNNHQNQKTRKEGWFTQLFKETECMYTSCIRTTHVYTWLSRKKLRMFQKQS
jgi:hypothetical protein